MAVVARWPNVITIVLAVALIGARQYGLAVLVHETAHGKLFRSGALNDGVGDWLCAAPIWLDFYSYRNGHLDHHAKTETGEAPRRRLDKKASAAKGRLLRNCWRDRDTSLCPPRRQRTHRSAATLESALATSWRQGFRDRT
jgi:fatty acid desaturase